MILQSRANASLPVNQARVASFGRNHTSPKDAGDFKRDKLTARRRLVYFRPPMQLKLYSRAWCSWCIDAKDYLSEKGYHFQEIDVGKDRQAYEEMKQLSAQTYVPTFVAGDKVLANFDTNQLQRFLNEHQINP
jgi:glutaredoxin